MLALALALVLALAREVLRNIIACATVTFSADEKPGATQSAREEGKIALSELRELREKFRRRPARPRPPLYVFMALPIECRFSL